MYNKEIKLGTGLIAYKYKYFLDKEHPLAAKSNGAVLYHRHIASICRGKWLNVGEEVHHIDGDPLNNSPENLEVLSKEEHARKHALAAYGYKYVKCAICTSTILITENTKQSKKYCSSKCTQVGNIKRPDLTKEILEELMLRNNWSSLGRLLGYTDTGIKKRAKTLGCDLTLISKKSVAG